MSDPRHTSTLVRAVDDGRLIAWDEALDSKADAQDVFACLCDDDWWDAMYPYRVIRIVGSAGGTEQRTCTSPTTSERG